MHQVTLEAGLGWGIPRKPPFPTAAPFPDPALSGGLPGARGIKSQVPVGTTPAPLSSSGGGEKEERNRREKGGKGQGLEVWRRDTRFPAWQVEGEAEEVRAEGEGAPEEEEEDVWGRRDGRSEARVVREVQRSGGPGPS